MPLYTVVDDQDAPRPMQHPAVTLVDHDGGPYNPATSIPPDTYADAAATTTALAGKVAKGELKYSITDAPYNAAVGLANNLTNIQAAINAASTAAIAAGTEAEVWRPPGVYEIDGGLQVKTRVRFTGPGRIKYKTGSTTSRIYIYGDDVTIEDLVVDVNNCTSSLGIDVVLASLSTVCNRPTVRRCRVINATSTAIRSYNPVTDLTFEDNVVEDCANGGLVVLSNEPTPNKNVRILRNRCRRVGGVNIQVYSAAASKHSGVLVEGNDLRDFTTPSTAIPIEVTGSDEAIIRGNVIGSVATRGVSTGNCLQLLIANNVMKDQTVYAVEIGTSKRVSVVGNIARNCKSLVQETNAGCEDVLIANNIYNGSGLSANSSSAPVQFAFLSKRVRIANNMFIDWQYMTYACIRIGVNSVTEDVMVEGNTFFLTDANSMHRAVWLAKAVGAVVRYNTFRVRRDLVAGDDYNALIQISIDAVSADILVEGNEAVYYGTVAAAPNSAMIGNGNVGAGALLGLRIRRNNCLRGIRGIRLVVNSTDMIVEGNDSRTCTSADVIPSTALPATNADTSGATLAALETEVNELKALLRTAQLLR